MKKELVKKSKKGFTLTEVLATVIIVVLFSLLVSRSIYTSSTVYQTVVDRANASTLLSTTISELRNELMQAKDLKIDDGSISYISALSINRVEISNSEDGIVVKEYADNVDSYLRPLVTRQAMTKSLHCAYGEVSYSDGLLVIENIVVSKSNKELITRPILYIRVG